MTARLRCGRGASKLYKELVETETRVLGPTNPATLADMHGLANCYSAMEDLPAALPLYQQARA